MENGSKRILREIKINCAFEFKNFMNQMIFLTL
jgi:hypothetical protein